MNGTLRPSQYAVQPGRSRHPTIAILAVSVVISTVTLVLPAQPASAASVIITPQSATGFVHADNSGAAVVDITVCASFDQPVRFIEAIVQFSGNMLGIAIDGPHSGAVTQWCGTVTDLAAGSPGNVVMDVGWRANNGNG